MSVGAQDVTARVDWLGGLTRALLAVAVLLAGVWLYARVQSPVAYFGTPYPNRPEAAAFTAVDQDGRSFDFTSTRGPVVALFFGFTRCPDICPLTLNYLHKARESLPAGARDDMRIVFVTLDPARDTVKQIREYMNFFGGNITGLRVPEGELKAVTDAYGVSFAKADTRQAGEYSINHTTATYLIDRAGKLRLVWDYTQLTQVEKVARDVRLVLEE